MYLKNHLFLLLWLWISLVQKWFRLRIKMEMCIKGPKKMARGMVGVGKFLLMVLAMRECGKITYLMVEGFSFNQMEVAMKVNFKIKRVMAMADMSPAIKRLFMKGSFRMMNKMDLEHRSKLENIDILVILKIQLKKGLGQWYGMMENNMKVFGEKGNFMAKAV